MDTNSNSNTNSISNCSLFFLALMALSACDEPKPPRADTSTSAGDDGEAEGENGDESEPDGTRGEPEGEDGSESEDPNEQIPPPDEEGCHAIYAQDVLPTFDLTIDPEVWEQLVYEWMHGQEHEDLGVDPDPYHPLAEFRYGDIVIKDAEIRLRGNPTWWNHDDKLQFQIGFDRNNDDGHFLGLKRLAFDAATYNRHLLRDRLALSIMRDMGVIAPCANNAKLNINGEYYGIFTSIEKIDEIFVKRVFEDPTGDLWKRQNWQLETNKDTATKTRLKALRAADTIDELEDYLDVGQALSVYAAEAIIPNSDGGWAGGLNFYLYDDPKTKKFILLPWDLDNTFERFNDPPDGEYPINPDPVVWEKLKTHGRPFYDIPLQQDEDWFWYYIDTIEDQFEEAYDVDELHDKIDTWTAQIQQAVFDDVNKPYTNKLYLKKVAELKNYVEGRHEWMEDWLDCWDEGGEPDGEGYCELP